MAEKAKIQADQKKKNSVIGKVFTGPNSGKIVFFNGKNKPAIGQIVFLDEVDDKGRFLIAKKWRVQKEEERTDALRIAMEGRIEFSSSSNKFREYNLGMLEEFGPEQFFNNYMEVPATALKLGLAGDEKLLEQVNQFKKNISSFFDIVAEHTIAFMDACKEVFEKGGDLPETMELEEFEDLGCLLIEIGKQQAWPIRGIESGPIGGYRYFCPTE